MKPKRHQDKKPKGAQAKPNKKKSLLASFEKDLEGSKFRYVNELLYTSRSDQAEQLFREKPDLFREYHEGYAHQVEDWPVNPLDVIIGHIQQNPDLLRVVDMGCGEARLALECSDRTVRSFDLHKANDRITVANLTKVPVQKGWADAVVFCLSLMGIDWHGFIREGLRVLKQNGLMFIAEPTSRIKNMRAFKNAFEAVGLVVVAEEMNNVFVLLTLRKNTAGPAVPDANFESFRKKARLTPCFYKRR